MNLVKPFDAQDVEDDKDEFLDYIENCDGKERTLYIKQFIGSVGQCFPRLIAPGHFRPKGCCHIPMLKIGPAKIILPPSLNNEIS